MRRKQKPPLANRFGLAPARVRMPEDGTWSTIRDFLVERLAAHVGPDRIDSMIAAGEIVDLTGPIQPDSQYAPDGGIWFHRDLPVEVPVPFSIDVIYRDAAILVVDKPHFLATIPRGRHVLETALMRLRRDLELPELIPAHRLDRATAGVLLFVIDPVWRGAYQSLFQNRRVHKVYEAIAPYRPGLPLPQTVLSRIIKERNIIKAFESEGEPNAETLVELIEHHDGIGRYRLSPHTGRTHQLRVHMNSLGIPIVGDDLYPIETTRALDDFTNPLQLLAAELKFRDPRSGEHVEFRTRRTLAAWLA